MLTGDAWNRVKARVQRDRIDATLPPFNRHTVSKLIAKLPQTKADQVVNVQILIVYDSKTGNTEKMASFIADGAREGEGINVVVQRVEATANDDLLQADGIIVGSPTYYGLMSGSLKAMFDESVKIHGQLEGKVGAAFTSSGGVASGAETTIISILQAMLIHGMVVQGRTRAEHYGAASVGEPKAQDEERYRAFGRAVAQLVSKLKS